MSERFGDYELLRKIATGGMAEIFLARLSSTAGFGRPVVVKRMLPQLAVRPDFVTMFLDEARLAANLAHPNVVQVFNLGEVDGAYYMAMELVDGPHLGSLFAHSLRLRKPLPVPYCVFITARSADGLDYAHNLADPATGLPLSIVHRDISPQNILVSRHGDVKVTDFGVAKASTQEAKTRTGIIKGKVSYMSPEQCLGEIVDCRTDVFALGIVLYELLTRRRLFRDKSDLLVMQRITNEDVAPPSTINPSADAELDEICRKALAKKRDERYSSAAELSEALDFWLATGGHADGRGGLSRWMLEHAPDLGLRVDAETTDHGEQDRFLEEAFNQSNSGEDEKSDVTASTPALQPVSRGDGDTVVAVEPSAERTEIASLSQVDEILSDPESTTTEPMGGGTLTDDTLEPVTAGGDTLLNAPAPGDERRPIPMAALGGGGAALALAAVIGVVMMWGEDPVDALPSPTADPQPVDRSDPRPEDPSAPETPAGRQRNGTAVDPTAPKVAPSEPDDQPAEVMATLEVVTIPPGARIELKPLDKTGESPVTFEVPQDAVRSVRAVFKSGVDVERQVELGEDPVKLVLKERVDLEVAVEPRSAQWSIEGPTGKVVGTGSKTIKDGLLALPGHKLQVRADGYEPDGIDLDVEPGQKAVARLRLEKKSSGRETTTRTRKPRKHPGYGRIDAFASPWVQLRVAGKAMHTPARGVRVKAGTHRLVAVNKELGISQTFRVRIPKDGTVTLKLRWEKNGDRWKLTKSDGVY